MRYYQDVTLLPSQEISLSFLWTKVFGQLHLGLVSLKDENNCTPIGIAFPEYKKLSSKRAEKDEGLGTKLRILADEEEELKAFGAEKLLERLKDYVHITSIRPIPNRLKGYAVYRRFHQAKSVAQQARRYARRHGISYEEAELLIKQKPLEKSLPYVHITSLTNHHSFELFIAKEEKSQPAAGSFGLYGLSSEATVPEF